MLRQSWLAKWRQNAAHLVGSLRGVRKVRRKATLPVQPEVLECRSLLTTTTISLGALGAGGITLNGVNVGDRSGNSVASIGDINGDGFDDVLIGAANSAGAENATSQAGESYVVFGKADWSATPALELSALDGTNGFTLYGVDVNDRSGSAVSGAGDVNGDGFDDLLIGAYGASGSSNTKASAGEVYLVFGKATWDATPTVNLGALNGTNGVTLYGIDAGDKAGYAVSSAGDVNGDGFADIIIGAPNASGASNLKEYSGESYVVFGKAVWTATPTVSLGSLNGTTGFTLYGADIDDESGKSVAGAGDVNGDGFADLIIGAPETKGSTNTVAETGESYIVFGKASWSSTATVNLGTLNGTTGAILYGIDTKDKSGTTVAGAGDINGDGFDDFLIGAPAADGASNLTLESGEVYVVFGKASWTATAKVNLSTLNGTTGFIVTGAATNDTAGTSVNGIGDLNADGFDDFFISAMFFSGPTFQESSIGNSYVVYGKSSWTSALSLATLDGTNGFAVTGADQLDQSGKSASGAGDFNGDGFVDLLIGSMNGDGTDNARSNSGETYVVFGGDFTSSATQVGTSVGETLTGTADVDKLVGGGGNDTLIGNGGADVLYGGPGNDVLRVSSTDFARIDGGNGTDTLHLTGSGLDLNLTTTPNSRIKNIEVIDIRGSGANSLTLNAAEVLNLTQNSNPDHTANTLRVRLDGNDTLNKGTGWTQGADRTVDGLIYNVFTQGNATLLVEVLGQVVADIELSISNTTMAEDGGTATITATLNEVSNEDVTVTLGFSGTATLTDDYTRTAAQIVIPAGSLSASITLTAVQDGSIETTESISVNIAGVSGGLEFFTDAVTTQILDDDNHAPAFTTSATTSVPENTTAIMTVIALDTDVPTQTITYSITGGADQNLFNLTSGGALTFKTARDYEAPGDAGGNNVYEVQITANDGLGGTISQLVSVTVTNVDDVPTADLIQVPVSVTWIKGQSAANVLPQVAAVASGNLAGSTLTITMNTTGTKKASVDTLTFASSSSIGTSSGLVYANNRLTLVIQLNQNATAEGIQTFLRGIRFSTKGKGLNMTTRRLDATIAIAGGASDTVSQTINVVKKVPKAPRVRNR